jgi:hypothetical protein
MRVVVLITQRSRVQIPPTETITAATTSSATASNIRLVTAASGVARREGSDKNPADEAIPRPRRDRPI